MKGMRKGLSVLACIGGCVAGGLAGGAGPVGWSGAWRGAAIGERSATTIIISGQRITVEVNLSLNQMPMGDGNLTADVRIATVNHGNLPAISAVRLEVDNAFRRVLWKPTLDTYATFAYDPTSLLMGAAGGPRLPLNSRVMALVDITSGGRVYRATVPVVVSVVR